MRPFSVPGTQPKVVPSDWPSSVLLDAVLRFFRSTSNETMWRVSAFALWRSLWSRAQRQACVASKPFSQPWLKSSPGPEALQAGPSDWHVATHTSVLSHGFHATNFELQEPASWSHFLGAVLGFKIARWWAPFRGQFWPRILVPGSLFSVASFGLRISLLQLSLYLQQGNSEAKTGLRK